MSTKNYRQPSTGKVQAKFAQSPTANIKRSRFDRSHGLKTTFGNTGSSANLQNTLVPIYWDEVLPGDSFHMKSTAFVRMATPLHPTMDNVYIDTHFFFVPYRLVWDNFQQFMGERRTPTDDPNDYTVPQINASAVDTSSNSNPHLLQYYFGLPMRRASSGSAAEHEVSALPFRAYNLIWNEWFRDENIQTPVIVDLGDGPDNMANYTQALPRGKRKDYFTSALPWPQKGDPVFIPMDISSGYLTISGWATGGSVNEPIETNGNPQTNPHAPFLQTDSGKAINMISDGNFGSFVNEATINDLRTAFQIQKLLERDARGGTRYIELILSHFGVRSSDARLQRPEFLGADHSRVNMAPVPSTATNANATTGDLGAYASSINEATFSKSFTEHGIIIGLMSYRTDLTYQRGVERFWSRQTRYDFFWPALAHLGEQAILRKELNFRGVVADDNEVFGYQERYGEYRFKPSRVTGLFNTDADGTLDSWHYGQNFDVDSNVLLNSIFIYDNPPIERTVAVANEPYFIADIWFDLKCDRPMPTYAIPGFVDHF